MADTNIQIGVPILNIEGGPVTYADYILDRNANKDVATEISELKNAGFITKAVNDLENYYLSSQTYTKDEINSLIAAIDKIQFIVAQSLPEASMATMNKIYLIPKDPSEQEQSDIKDEYITIASGLDSFVWEKIGSTEVDLSDYYTKLQVDGLLNNKQNTIDSDNKLDSDLVDDSNSTTHKFVTEVEKYTWNSKQNTLVSGSNIKTINNQSLLGEGNIEIQGGGQVQSDWDEEDSSSAAYIQHKPDMDEYIKVADLIDVDE